MYRFFMTVDFLQATHGFLSVFNSNIIFLVNHVVLTQNNFSHFVFF